ncbi:MAG: hypothetical protein AAFN07_14540 [Pseudomonadota bacterium]
MTHNSGATLGERLAAWDSSARARIRRIPLIGGVLHMTLKLLEWIIKVVIVLYIAVFTYLCVAYLGVMLFEWPAQSVALVDG